MKLERAVINSGPLIALSLAGKLDLLPCLFREFWIPDVVYREVTDAGIGKPGSDVLSNPHWAQYVRQSPEPDPLLISELDPGEASVITLARISLPCMAIIDEKRGRRIAQYVYGLPVKGTAGLLVAAQRRGLLDDLYSTLHDLRKTGYFLSDAVIEAACQAASQDR